MASSDTAVCNMEEEIPISELSVKDKTIEEILKRRSTCLSELSVKDQKIEEILQKKSIKLSSKKAQKAKNRKGSKMKIKKRCYKIIRTSINYHTTKSKFDEAMELLNSPGQLFPNNFTKNHCHQRINDIVSCKKYGKWQPLSHLKLLEQAKTCLQNQDWPKLTKILIYLSSDKLPNHRTLTCLLQYTFLLVLHDPVAKKENFLNVFLENCCGCKNNEDKANFLERIFKIPTKKFKPLVR